jgi:DNA polymerase I-like protein with 3'-5' exonuclease and polymerase domains
MSLDDISLSFARTYDELGDFWRWLGERHANDAIAVDTETTGFDPREPGAAIRLIQFGDTTRGWAFPAQDWSGLAREALNRFEGTFVLHHARFDCAWISTHLGFKFPAHRTVDTMLASRLIYPTESAALKALSKRLIDPRAGAGEEALHSGMTAHGWTWATVPFEFEPYSWYSALDTVLTAQLWDQFRPRVEGADSDVAEAFRLEMATAFICMKMEERGMRIDTAYARSKRDTLVQYADDISAWARAEFGVNLGSTRALSKALLDAGAPLTERTASGAFKVDRRTLDDLLLRPDLTERARALATQCVSLRESRKIASSYFDAFLEAERDGFVHPTINTMAARTHRMCLPTTHRLLTQRGITHIDDVRVGDETLDANNTWVRVSAIHRYTDQDIVVRQFEHTRLENTPEHRWLVSPVDRDTRSLEPLGDEPRLIHLVPETLHPYTPEILRDECLDLDALLPLKNPEDLFDWVMQLNRAECEVFLNTVRLPDSSPSTSAHNAVIEAIQLAGYRCGMRSRITTSTDTGGITIEFDVEPVNTADVLEVTHTVGDVWCVSTSSGTFTAWSDAPYLTGNSINSPPLQQLPRGSALVRGAFLPLQDDHRIVSCDFDQIEFRLTAELTGEDSLVNTFRGVDEGGGDIFTSMGRDMYSDPSFSKKDPRRNLVKACVYAKSYGASVRKMAETTGVPIEHMQEVSDKLDQAYPRLSKFMKELIDVGLMRERMEGEPYVRLASGRRLPADTGSAYKLMNYLIQGTAGEVLKRSLVRLDASGWAEYAMIPIHDEVLFSIPEDLVANALHEIPLVMEERDHAVPLTAGAEGPYATWGEKYESSSVS